MWDRRVPHSGQALRHAGLPRRPRPWRLAERQGRRKRRCKGSARICRHVFNQSGGFDDLQRFGIEPGGLKAIPWQVGYSPVNGIHRVPRLPHCPLHGSVPRREPSPATGLPLTLAVPGAEPGEFRCRDCCSLPAHTRTSSREPYGRNIGIHRRSASRFGPHRPSLTPGSRSRSTIIRDNLPALCIKL